MGNTNIDWADKVWNPVSGCTKISEGCKNCYAERMHTRLEKIKNSGYCDGKPHFSIRLHPERLEEPLKWKKPQRVFVCSMGDLFHKDVLWPWLDGLFSVMHHAPQHTYLILTKRPDIALHYFNSPRLCGSTRKNNEFLTDNIWIGVSAENQQAADERIPVLLQIPAAKRFVSVEPMLNFIDLSKYIGAISLCIVGGETGPKARPMHPNWVRSIRDQCHAAGVPFFFKSWGEFLHGSCVPEGDDRFRQCNKWEWAVQDKHAAIMARIGKKAAGHLLDGKEYREWPEGGN